MIKSKTMSLLPPYSSWSILCDLVCHWWNKLTWAAWKHLRDQVLLSSQCFSDHTVSLHFGHLTLWTHTENTDFYPLFFKRLHTYPHGAPNMCIKEAVLPSQYSVQVWKKTRNSEVSVKIILRTCSILVFFSSSLS